MPTENLGRRAHKNESGIKQLCSDWREVSDRFSVVYTCAEMVTYNLIIKKKTFACCKRLFAVAIRFDSAQNTIPPWLSAHPLWLPHPSAHPNRVGS